MLSSLFGFRGRLRRLPYFGWIAFVALLWTIWLVVIFGSLAAGLARGSLGALAGSALVAVVGVVPIVWMFLALASKRLRDAGFPPLLVLPPVIVFSLFDAFVLSRHHGGQPLGPLVHHTPVGLTVNVMFSLLLLFWPSAAARGDDEDRRSGEAPWHERALTLAGSLAPDQTPASHAPPMASAGQPRPFGRRMA